VDTAPKRSAALAAVLGFVWPGIGYLYAGDGLRGLVLLLLFPVAELCVMSLAVGIPLSTANVAIPAALVLAMRLWFARGAARRARAFPTERPLPFFSRWYSCVAAVLLAPCPTSLWAHAYRNSLVQSFKAPAGSMEPTILIGDHLLAVNWAYGWRDPVFGRTFAGARSPQRGDLVVFRYPDDRSREFIKRCIALPGEVVEVRGRTVYIGGKALDEPYARFLTTPATEPEETDERNAWGPQLVPAGQYFVLGDNRDNSRDSRFFGFVPQDDLLGRASLVYWSYDAPRGEYAHDWLDTIEQTLAGFARTRWGRIGHRLE
jgi:signal peptidase I